METLKQVKKSMETESAKTDLPIYDIYVLKEGGFPIFAGCSTSDYCASHEGQHPLHTGFINAIKDFGYEVFSGGINEIKFPKVRLNFKHIDPYTIVFVNPRRTNKRLIENKLEEVALLFMEKYADKVEEYVLSDKLYMEFMDDVVKLGLVARDSIKSTRSIFISDTEKVHEKGEIKDEEDSSIFSRFKKKFQKFVMRQ